MPKKTIKSTTKKKSTAKKISKTEKTSAQDNAPRRTEKRKNPVYVLIIMGLITVIALMVNKFYLNMDQITKESHPKQNVLDDHNHENSSSAIKNPTDHEIDNKSNKKENTIKGEKDDAIKKRESKTIKEKPNDEIVKIYLIKFNEKTEKMFISAVERKVSNIPLLENTIKELIKGPTVIEKKKGFLSAVPADLRVYSVKIKNNIAEIDFNNAIEKGANGSILLNRIDQIVYTVTQFKDIKSVEIKINGKKQESLGTDGLSIGGPLHRRQ